MLYRDWLVFNSFDWCILILTVLMGCSLSSLLFHSSPAVVFLDRGIHASGISIPPSLLTLLGWSLMWITSLTLHVYQCRSRDHLGFTLRWRFVQATSPLPTTTRHTHCFQVWNYAKVTPHPATWLNKTVLFTEFRVIAAKFTSARVEDLWKTG